MPSLSNLWPPITNLSQKEKQCSFVLYSFKASLGAEGRGEDDMWTGRKKKTKFAPEIYIHRTNSQNTHCEYLKHTELAPQLHSANNTCLQSCFCRVDEKPPLIAAPEKGP